MKQFIHVYEENSRSETELIGLINVDTITMLQEQQDNTRGIGGIVFYRGGTGIEHGLVSGKDFNALLNKMA